MFASSARDVDVNSVLYFDESTILLATDASRFPLHFHSVSRLAGQFTAVNRGVQNQTTPCPVPPQPARAPDQSRPRRCSEARRRNGPTAAAAAAPVLLPPEARRRAFPPPEKLSAFLPAPPAALPPPQTPGRPCRCVGSIPLGLDAVC